MAGNSAEWCADYFDHASYAKAPPGGVAINPTGATQAFQPGTWYKYRVMFKGWYKSNRADYFTSTKRHSRPPLADASAGVSFRCVKSADENPPLAAAPFTTGQAADFRAQWAKHAGVEPEVTNSIGMKPGPAPAG